MNKLAKNVYRYFLDRIAETGSPLNETESALFNEARSCMNIFPISCLSRDDLHDIGYNPDKLTDEQMNVLAQKMGEDYCEQLFWTSLESMANIYKIPKKSVDVHMRDAYKEIEGDDEPHFATVVIRYKNDNSMERVYISIGNMPEDYLKKCWVKQFFHNVNDIDELCGLCNKNNRYGFYIKEFIQFG